MTCLEKVNNIGLDNRDVLSTRFYSTDIPKYFVPYKHIKNKNFRIYIEWGLPTRQNGCHNIEATLYQRKSVETTFLPMFCQAGCGNNLPVTKADITNFIGLSHFSLGRTILQVNAFDGIEVAEEFHDPGYTSFFRKHSYFRVNKMEK